MPHKKPRSRAHPPKATQRSNAVTPAPPRSAPAGSAVSAFHSAAPAKSLSAPVAGKAPPGQGSPGKGAPGEIELKGNAKLKAPSQTLAWLEGQEGQRGEVQARFGRLARGPLLVRKSGEGVTLETTQALPLRHELFARLGEVAPELQPSLIVHSDGEQVRGHVGLRAGTEIPGAPTLSQTLRRAPALLGLPGFELPKLPLTNRLEGGALELGVEGATVHYGSLLRGTLSLTTTGERITSFTGTVAVTAQGLASGSLELQRTPEGQTTGEAQVELNLPKNFSGSLRVQWDGESPRGEGTVGYQGEKLSGSVHLQLMEKGQAARLEQEAKAPPREAAEKTPAASEAAPAGAGDFAVFGEGDLEFSFTDWLHGTAQVMVDSRGFVTILGKITPQKEFELFPQKDYTRELFEVEARASYGIPVVGNIFIFASVGLSAFAKLGPAKLYKIEVEGTYSTDPKKSQNFQIQGTLNLSAAAGLKLRGTAGAGVEILDHDIKAGAGINGLAGIRGYVEANPRIGYREKPGEEGVDRKGEFFIKGTAEIAGQPFLGLSGDLFVELDAPWWSPAPDKTWDWPLAGKEWPMGGSFGIGASMDYVLGSSEVPAVEFQKVDFSADKFFTDLYCDKAQPGASKKAAKPGRFQEGNTPGSAPPSGKSRQGNAKPGEAPERPPARAKVKRGGPRKSIGNADPNARTADGKTVRQLQMEATRKRGRKASKPGAEKTRKSTKAAKSSKTRRADKAEDPKVRWQRGVAAVKQALAFARNKGIGKDELNRILKSIRRQKKYGFQKLEARKDEQNPKYWRVDGRINPVGLITRVLRDEVNDPTQKRLEKLRPPKEPGYTPDSLGRAQGPRGYVQGVKEKGEREKLPAVRKLPGGRDAYQPGDHRGHLIGDRFMGPATAGNLVPMHRKLNLSTFKTFEDAAANAYKTLKKKKKPVLLYMRVVPHYPLNDDKEPASYRPTSITAKGKIVTLEKRKKTVRLDQKMVPRGGPLPNPTGDIQPKKTVTLNDKGTTQDAIANLGYGSKLAAEIKQAREKYGEFRRYSDLMKVPGLDKDTLDRIRKDRYVKLWKREEK